MSGFTYRIVEPSDLPTVVEAKKRSLSENADWDEKTLGEIAENFVNAIRRGVALVYLAYNGEKLAGFGTVYIWDGGCSSLSDFYVLPEYRHKGVMHGLLKLLIETARERGCKSVWLLTDKEYRAHWQELGFRDMYEENDEGITELSQRMEMPLN